MDLQTVLLAAASPDASTRQQAEALLQQATETQYGPFLQALCIEFVSEDKPEANRQMAGLYMKNLIVANDSSIKANKLEKWQACAEKEIVKSLFLQGLHSASSVVRDTAAQILAAFGAAEIEHSKWDELIPALLHNVSEVSVSHGAKVATLKALGYLCDELVFDLPAGMVNTILSAIITGITADKPNDMRYAAVKALKDSLIFAGNNFKVDNERNHIMTSIYDAALSPDANIRETAYECLVKVAENYYDLLAAYMPQLIQLTLNCVQTDPEENVQKQAIEFWSVICETEDDEEDSNTSNLKIMVQCFTAVTPVLLSTLVKQSEDLDEWNVASAGGQCLKLLTKVVGDPIVDMIIGFVASNIQSADWRFREAAILAFGSMLNGPKDKPKMVALVKQCMQFLLQYFKDQNPVVKSSSLWTVSEICNLYPEVAVWDESVFPSVMTNVLEAANDRQPKNVALAASIFRNVAVAVGDKTKETNNNSTNILSKWNTILFQKLFELVDRPDGDKESMRDDSFEAIISLVEYSADDSSSLIGNLLQETQRRLTDTTNKILQVQSQQVQGRDPDSNLLSKLLASIGMSIRRLPSSYFENDAVTDAVMASALTQFTIAGNGALGDAFIVINEIAEKIGRRFERYIGHFDKFLYSALKYEYGKEACEKAVDLIVPAICDALQDKITEYIQEIMQRMLELLSNNGLPRDLKPKVIESFGDVALAIKGNFTFFLQTILLALQKAGEASHQFDTSDEDLVEYFNALRQSIISAYSNILYGLSDSNKHTEPALTSQVPTIMQLLMLTMKDDNTSPDVVNKCLGLLGDLGAIYGVSMKSMYQNVEIQQLVQKFYSEKDHYHQSEYCFNIVTKVLNMP